jgi:hypothetical protein
VLTFGGAHGAAWFVCQALWISMLPFLVVVLRVMWC